jgi:hypothetical protein
LLQSRAGAASAGRRRASRLSGTVHLGPLCSSRLPNRCQRGQRDEYDALIQTIALTMGVAWASGINLYAAVAMLGLGGMLRLRRSAADAGSGAGPAGDPRRRLHVLRPVHGGQDARRGHRLGRGAHVHPHSRRRRCWRPGLRVTSTPAMAIAAGPGGRHRVRGDPRHQGRQPGADQHLAGAILELGCLAR